MKRANAKLFSLIVLAVAVCGCAVRPSLFPNSDPDLRKTSTQFAADAAKRHPFKADAPSGGQAPVTAQYDLTFATLQLLNIGEEDWTNIEVWVNRNYVCFVPTLEKGKARVKTLNFQMLFDDSGNYFWTDNGKNPIQTVEILHGGKMYSVPTKLAD